jgi:predicted TIM-barrel fold metal-dependent hydrolase
LSVEELLAEMDAAGVDRATMIPPEWDRYGNELVLDGAAAHPGRLAAFPSVSLRDPDSPGKLAQWARLPGFLGLRQVFLAGPAYSPLTDGTADWLWRAADDLGLTMMVWLPGQLSALPAIVDRFPGIRFIVDHLNMAMDIDRSEVESLVTELLALADRQQVAVKASALPAIPSVRQAVRRVVAAFGTDRVFWGSDFTRLPCTYRQAVAMVDDFDVDRAALLGDAFDRWLPWPS